MTDTFGVNAADWLVATSNTSGVDSTRSYTYSYDAAGQQRVQRIVGTASAAYTTTLDPEGRATSLSEAFLPGPPFTATWTYNQNDEPVTAALSQTVQQALGYDAASRLITLTAQGPNASPPSARVNASYAHSYTTLGWTADPEVPLIRRRSPLAPTIALLIRSFIGVTHRVTGVPLEHQGGVVVAAAFTVKIDEELRDKLDRIAAAHQRSRNFIAIEAFERYVAFELCWIEDVSAALQEEAATDEHYSLDDVRASTDQAIAQARLRKPSE